MDGGRILGSAIGLSVMLSGLVVGARVLYEKATTPRPEQSPETTDGKEIGDEEG